MFNLLQNGRLWFHRCLVLHLIVFSSPAVYAQEPPQNILITGEHGKLERSLSQPEQYLQRVGISRETIVSQLRKRPRIAVADAGATYSVALEETLVTDAEILTQMDITLTQAQRQLTSQMRIHVNNAGFTRESGLQAFTNLQQTDAGIQVVGAGSVRLMSTDQLTSTRILPVTEPHIHVNNAGSVRNIKQISPQFR